MSLASRTLDLLPAASTTQAQNYNINDLVDNGCKNNDLGIAGANTGRQTTKFDAMAPEEVEDEGRPPYLHVSQHTSFPAVLKRY